MFAGLRCMHRMQIIHADLKPDNILLSENKMDVKIADFGTAVPVQHKHRSADVQPRYYRAPEVILGQDYDCSIDMWSAGCTYTCLLDESIFVFASLAWPYRRPTPASFLF